MKDSVKFIELKSKTNRNTFYTYPEWGEKDIDGVMFTPVTKFPPILDRLREVHYMRSDDLERVKK